MWNSHVHVTWDMGYKLFLKLLSLKHQLILFRVNG